MAVLVPAVRDEVRERLVQDGRLVPARDRWLHQRATQLWVTSIICRVEVVRVARCLAAAADGARLLLAGLDMIPLVEHVADVAQTIGPATLPTLDAIRLVSALSVRDELIAFCCYDRRLLDAAGDTGLPVYAPGT